MLSGQTLQSTIDEISRVTNTRMSVYDSFGKQLGASRGFGRPYDGNIVQFVNDDSKILKNNECALGKVFCDQNVEYVVCARMDSTNHMMALELACFQLEQLVNAYKDRNDKDNFIKNLLLDNLLVIDVYTRAKKLHLDMNVRRNVLIIEAPDRGSEAFEVMRKVCSGRNGVIVCSVDEKSVIVVYDIRTKDPSRECRQFAAEIIETLNTEGITGVRVAYGGIAQDLKTLSRSYKEARLSLEVGKVFFEKREIVGYDSLGIGRLIYQLPISFCRMFIDEIFAGQSPEEFDEGTLETINKFFENNLNVSQTSRELFIHRNTLVYRLDKLQKATGLDLRVFEDAITFKIALMVGKFLNYMDSIPG